jgi:hypothetical protein
LKGARILEGKSRRVLILSKIKERVHPNPNRIGQKKGVFLTSFEGGGGITCMHAIHLEIVR